MHTNTLSNPNFQPLIHPEAEIPTEELSKLYILFYQEYQSRLGGMKCIQRPLVTHVANISPLGTGEMLKAGLSNLYLLLYPSLEHQARVERTSIQKTQ